MGDVTLSMTIFCIQSVVECADETGEVGGTRPCSSSLFGGN